MLDKPTKKMKYLNACAISLIGVLLFTGCASLQTQNRIPRATVSQKLQLLYVGMSQSNVIETIGQPHWSRTEETASGRIDVWLYDYLRLVERIEGGGAAFWSGVQRGGSGVSSPPVELRFENRNITSIVNR